MFGCTRAISPSLKKRFPIRVRLREHRRSDTGDRMKTSRSSFSVACNDVGFAISIPELPEANLSFCKGVRGSEIWLRCNPVECHPEYRKRANLQRATLPSPKLSHGHLQ